MSVGGYSHYCIYLEVYGPEIIDSFGLEEKSQKRKQVCLSRKNKLNGGFQNVRPPIIDPVNLLPVKIDKIIIVQINELCFSKNTMHVITDTLWEEIIF